MADQYYDSDLTGKQLDAAFAKMANIDTYANQAASSASEASGYAETATSAASQAQTYASQANTAKNNAQTYAGQASDSADSAQTYAGQASGSASAAAASAASIEGDVEAAANSASQAATSASQAAESASDAADAAQTADDAKSTVQQSASAAQTAATQAAQSAQDAQSAATQASGSASTAQSAATLIEDNLEAIQAAPTNAQAAQTSAQAAEASASAAEAAADRAEQIADFDPADFATAAQGAKADTAVQSVNGKTGTAITLGAADVGAATAAQGSLAETAVQPDALDAYALKTDVPDTPADIGAATAAQGAKADTAVQSVNGAKPDSSGNVQLDLTTGTVRSVNGKDPDGSGNVQLSAGDVGAAEPLIGTTDTLTPQQVRDALLAGRLCVVTDATGGSNHTVAEWAVISSRVQGLSGWALNDLGSGQRLHLSELCGYFDERGWVLRDIYAPVLPEITAADNGKTVSAQNGVWALADAASGGGKMTLIRDTGWDSCGMGQTISLPDLSGYDAIGIQVVPDVQKSATSRSQMNIFPIPASGSSECMLCASEIDNGTNFAELVARRLTMYGTTLIIGTLGYFLNFPGGPPSAQLCVPRTIYGIKF